MLLVHRFWLNFINAVPYLRVMNYRLHYHTCKKPPVLTVNIRVEFLFFCFMLTVFPFMPAAKAEVTGYTTSTTEGRTVLTSVTARRDGRLAIFDASRLIGVRVVHFKAAAAAVIAVPAGARPPAPEELGSLLGLELNAGLINPGGQKDKLAAPPVLAGPDATMGLAVEFNVPVMNLDGDDIVLFELQTSQNSALTGDPVHIVPLEWRDGLHPITINTYEIAFDNPKARTLADFELFATPSPASSLESLAPGALKRTGTGSDFKALAVGIDLSHLGYAPGESVGGIFLQNANQGEPAVDPVCIAGLPTPEGQNVLAVEPRTIEDDPTLLIEQFLASPESDFDEIVFAIRVPGDDHWYANFGYYSSPVREYPPQRAPDGVKLPPIFKDGGRLCRLNLRTHELTVLLDAAKGSVRDPQVHYSGEKILFSYRKEGEPCFHLYEIRPDGTGLMQLIDGPYNDIEPAYLPDGGIVFCSDRCNRFVNCWITPVATLYRCDADGSGIRMISSNIEHDNTPWVLPDGRVLYMRWEYVDRSQSHFHHLWTVNPDGTNHTAYYGNERPGIVMLDAKPIPGTNNVLASFSPGHGIPEHAGYITVVNPELGPDAESAAARIGKGGPVFRDPYPISSAYWLVARNEEILLMDRNGNTAGIYRLAPEDPPMYCHEPRPLRPREREHVIPPRVDPSKETGRLALADVYTGRNMTGVERGDITRLLVLETLPKPVNFSGGMWPTSAGGTFTLSRILGTVPVEPDGSAYFEVPAMRSLYFVALDKDGLAVKRMHSFTSVMPGESTGCVGCHEPRVTAPMSGLAQPAAMRRAPDTVVPIENIPEVMDFPRDIQPILDKHCVACHNPDQYNGKSDLTGDHAPLFSQSYWTILQHGLIADGRNEPFGNRAPRTVGSSASRILQMMDGVHYDVRASDLEKNTVRLWIESSAPYAGTYAALGTSMFPVHFPVEMMERRCGSCHGSPPPGKGAIYNHQYFTFGKGKPAYPLVHSFMDLQQIRAQIGYYKFGNARPPQSLCNLTRPEMSLLLRAPLALEAGGAGLCGTAVFTARDDPDYLVLLDAIRAASAQHDAEKCFDMPGFRPNDYYIYHLQRYGVLAKDLQSADLLDGYAADRAYWQSFWYRPGQGLY